MKENVYARLEISPSSGYVRVERMFYEEDLQEEYNDTVDLLTRYNKNQRVETIEGYKLQHILVNVKFDGRKRIKGEDVLKALLKQNLVEYCGDNIFGGIYKPTDELKNILDSQLQKRKEIAGVA